MRHTRPLGRKLTAVLVACLFVCAVRPATAGQGFTVSLPVPPAKPPGGLSLFFDCTWAEGYGYVPMRVTINCAKPAGFDRQLQIEITNRAMGERMPISVTSDLVVPAGAASATKVIPFPRCSINSWLSLYVRADGVNVKELSFEDRLVSSTGIGQGMAPATLFVTSAPVDVSQLGFMIGATTINYGAGITGTTPPQPNTIGTAQIAPFTSLPVQGLFDDWINYSGLDVIFIPLSDLETLALGRPQVLKALRDWTMAGGNLCVYGCTYGIGDKWNGLPRLEELLACPVAADDGEGRLRGWTEPKPEIYNLAYQLPGGAVVVRDEADLAEGAKSPRRANKPKPPVEPTFVSKHLGLGLVVAMADLKPFPGSSIEWRWLFNSIGPDRSRWEPRHGLSMTDGNPRFDEFTIADVGLPPVRAYRVLITLFVVVIGPVNYWWLRRKGRLHLLLFTVPAAAIVVSLSLVAYAVIADGFDSYLRAFSYTKLDQQRDEAVSWARLSYYAGLAPSDGLMFARDTAVFPFERDAYYQTTIHPLRHLDWTPAQHLVRGWVPSRTPVQFLTVRPYACQRELRILETTEPVGCAVENRLETKIHHLMLRSAAGDLYYGHDVDAAARTALEALDTDEKAQQAVIEILGVRSKTAPAAAPTVSTPVSKLFFGNRARYWRSGNRYSTNRSSLLETGIRQAFSDVGSHLPQPRTYVAIVERPPDVTVGVDDLIERQSLHVIFGTW